MYMSWIPAKRIFDTVFAFLGLMAAAPVMLAVALLIRATSKGPVFFLQERVGLREEIFRVRKFRTMFHRPSEQGSSVTTSGDPRITGLGRYLRRTKMDELPQLINVLQGHMSLVGPRPDVPEIVRNYTPEMKRIFLLRPGITSTATLHLRDEERLLEGARDPDRFYEEVLVPLKVELAMEHLDRRSLAFDLRILLQTLWMLTLGRWRPIPEHPALAMLKERIGDSFDPDPQQAHKPSNPSPDGDGTAGILQ